MYALFTVDSTYVFRKEINQTIFWRFIPTESKPKKENYEINATKTEEAI
jgi:hypothetical protein